MSETCPLCGQRIEVHSTTDRDGSTQSYVGVDARELADLQETFDLLHKADQRAVARWQLAHPDQANIFPDTTNLLVWLMERIEAVEKERDAVNRVVAALSPPLAVAQEYFERITAMRLQIEEWADYGVSRADMEAYLKSEGQ